MRWSSKFENHTVPPSAIHAPPPYSCTRVRALNGAGFTSATVPSGVIRTMTLRPPSDGRPSVHRMASPSMATCPMLMDSATMASAVMGERQEP